MVAESRREISDAAERGQWVWIPAATESGWLAAELLSEFRRRRTALAVTFAAAGALAFAATLLMPVQFRSVAVLAPASNQSLGAVGGLAGQLSGIASLTGLQMPAPVADRGAVTLATLSSRAFLIDFARRHGLVTRMFGDRWDASAGQWTTGGLFSRRGEPTEDEIAEAMGERIAVEQDPVSGLVTLSVLDDASGSARNVAQALIRDLNEQIRAAEVREAERSIEYLHQQVAGTEVAELRQVFYALIEDRTKSAMLASISDEFALKTVDPPSLPDDPATPRRLLTAVLAAVLALVLAVFWIMLRFALRSHVDVDRNTRT